MAVKKAKEDADFFVDWAVTQSVRHNGEDYQVGEMISLTEKESHVLLELGAIGIGGYLKNEANAETPPESGAV